MAKTDGVPSDGQDDKDNSKGIADNWTFSTKRDSLP